MLCMGAQFDCVYKAMGSQTEHGNKIPEFYRYPRKKKLKRPIGRKSATGALAFVMNKIDCGRYKSARFVDDRVFQNADPFDLHFDAVSVVQRTHSGRCAGEDDVTGL